MAASAVKRANDTTAITSLVPVTKKAKSELVAYAAQNKRVN
jgi:hypothetical protein